MVIQVITETEEDLHVCLHDITVVKVRPCWGRGGGGGGGVSYPLSHKSINSVIPKSISVGVFPTNGSEKVKLSINFSADAIYMSSFSCFPLRITVLMLLESYSTAGIVTVVTAYLNASFLRLFCIMQSKSLDVGFCPLLLNY